MVAQRIKELCRVPEDRLRASWKAADLAMNGVNSTIQNVDYSPTSDALFEHAKERAVERLRMLIDACEETIGRVERAVLPTKVRTGEINGKTYHWEGPYLVDDQGICPHGVPVRYRCDGCDAETWMQSWGQDLREEV